MHFCKNFFIRDRLEQSNERLPQNLENLYRKKKICSNKNSLLSYKPWKLLNNCSTKVFQNFSHNTRLCFRCWWLFWWCVCVCVCVCVCLCVCVFLRLCAKIRISDSNQWIYIKERKRRQALWTLWDLWNGEAFGNWFCILFLLPVNIYWVTSMS